MIILTTSATAQSLSVIPRSYVSTFTLSITDDSTNVEKTYSITNAVNSGNYLNFNNIFNPILVENHFYDLKLISNGEVIFKDRIFCTDQDIDQLNNNHYDLNSNEYLDYNGYDNTYLVR
jgi:hypothetical protein